MNINSFSDKDVPYKELSAWVTVAIITTMLLYYINHIAKLDMAGRLNSESHNQLLFLLVTVTIVTELIYHIAVGVVKIFQSEAKQDERDKWFELKASRISNHFISVFVALLILVVSQSDWLIEQLSLNMRGLSAKDVLLSVLVVGFALAQLIHHLSLAVYYRKGD